MFHSFMRSVGMGAFFARYARHTLSLSGPNRTASRIFSILGLSELDDLERACPKGIGSGMIKPAEIDPTVLAQSVLGLLMRSGRRRADGLGRTVEIEQESGETMVFSMLADNAFNAAHVARVRIWLADRLVLDVELDREDNNHIVRTFDDAEWAGVLLAAPRARQDQITKHLEEFRSSF